MGTSNEQLFHEGFLVLEVAQTNIDNFNFVAGFVPFVQYLLHIVSIYLSLRYVV